MSAYTTDEYEFSFAERTIKNLEKIQQIIKEERLDGKTDHEIKDAFEVTQLINSFVGLLIIPRQKFYEYMPDDASFSIGSEAEELFNRIEADPTKCEDTYYKKVRNPETRKLVTIPEEKEKITPKILVLRLRNAVSHDNLIIHPRSPGREGVITGIEFMDKPPRSHEARDQHFRLLLTIKETEVLVRALSELLLSCYPK